MQTLHLLPKFFLLVLKNIRRSVVRSSLTAGGTVLLVLVVTLVWSILWFLDKVTSEKKSDLKAIISERWQIPSQMPFSYASTLEQGAAREATDVRPSDSMTWQFYGGNIDKVTRTRDSSLFAFALEPAKLLTMMDDLDTLTGEPKRQFTQVVEKFKGTRQGIVLGRDRLKSLNKRVGDKITLYGINYRDIDLELEIVGLFPEGRYDNSAAINRDYLLAALEQYKQEHKGQSHPLEARTLNLVWLRVPDKEQFSQLAAQIESSPFYASPYVKCETASSGISTFLDAYKDLIWGMRWLLAPACLVSLSLVISNAISISVRERRLELAVLKVLGFRPWQILLMVLGEALILGAGAGFLSSAATYLVVNNVFGGLKFPIAFFPAFYIPADALWWGPVVGGLAALAGTVFPAWSACRVKVTDVFSRVT